MTEHEKELEKGLEKHLKYLSEQLTDVQQKLAELRDGKRNAEVARLMKGFEKSIFPYSKIDPKGRHSAVYQGKIRFFDSKTSLEEDRKSGSLECTGPSGKLIISLLEIIADMRDKYESE